MSIKIEDNAKLIDSHMMSTKFDKEFVRTTATDSFTSVQVNVAKEQICELPINIEGIQQKMTNEQDHPFFFPTDIDLFVNQEEIGDVNILDLTTCKEEVKQGNADKVIVEEENSLSEGDMEQKCTENQEHALDLALKRHENVDEGVVNQNHTGHLFSLSEDFFTKNYKILEPTESNTVPIFHPHENGPACIPCTIPLEERIITTSVPTIPLEERIITASVTTIPLEERTITDSVPTNATGISTFDTGLTQDYIPMQQLRTCNGLENSRHPYLYYKCTMCEGSFSLAAELRVHMKTHTGGKPHRCTMCNKAFKRLTYLKGHLRRHTGYKPFNCTICEKPIASAKSLKNHMMSHTGERPYKCTMCNKAFIQVSHLKIHTMNHFGEKPFSCTACDKAFVRRDCLKEHMKKHTGEKPFHCTICKRAFARADTLRDHAWIHTGNKPFKCTLCDKSFVQAGNLKEHMKKHIEEKPYKCNLCDKTFTLNTSLKRHKRTHSEQK